MTEPRGSERRRRRQVLRRIQRRLEGFYGIEQTPDVRAFVREGDNTNGDVREAVLVRECDDALEVAVVLPEESHSEADLWLQLVEGVSHFVYLTNRARMELPLTQLELELQAEVDKYVLSVLDEQGLEPSRAIDLHARLYENVRFLHPAGSELGERYRTANGLAARYVRRLIGRDIAAARGELRRFYRAGQQEKIRIAAA